MILILVYLSAMAVLFVSGLIVSAAPPDIYVRSSVGWMIMIAAVGGTSIAFVAPLELVPGVLEGSEERFRLAFENANVGICLTGIEGRLLKVNAMMSEMLGYSREELEQLNVRDITHKDDLEESLNFINQAPAGGRAEINFEKRYIHKRGDVIWANVSSSLILGSRDNPRYFITHIQDITERKRAEEALRESEAKLRAMFESSKDAIGVSKKGVHIYANPSYLKLFGFENNESIIDTSIIDSIAPSHREQLMEYVERRFAGMPVPKFYEARGMKVDGTEFDAEFNVSTYELHGELYSLAIIRDITERKRGEEALNQSMEQLHALTMRLENIREEERKSVSREVHDELGQTLTALRMDLMSLKKMGATNANAIEAKLQSMLDLTTNAIKSVQDISARLRPGMLDDLGLVSAIEWQTEEFEKRSGISCTLRLPDHDLEVDNERSTVLFRILQETLTNVARHAHAEHITVGLLVSKDEIVMNIHDDGIGISDESVRNPKSLGLLGIRERLHPFQGSCSIQRGMDGGTEVRVQLPIRTS
ncbi:MAG: PAS domain S-box protein [Bacteroidota bacterium]